MAFPKFIQFDSSDCGPTCIRIVAKHYGKQFNLSTLRDLTFKTKTGVSLLSISTAAEKIGFRTQGSKVSYDMLQTVQLPCIVHWRQKHFIVVYKIRGEKIYVSDPAVGLIRYSKKEFLDGWAATRENNLPTGIILTLEPTPEFYLNKTEKIKRLSLLHLVSYLKPYKQFVGQIALSFVAGSIIGLIFPFLSQSMVDIGISTNNIDFILVVLISQIVLTLGQTSIGFIQSWIMLHLSSRVSISLVSDFLIKLMRLPINYFDSKVIGDISQRMSDNSRVQSFLTGSLVSMSFNVFIFIIYSFIMAYYSWPILIIFYVGSILHVGWIVFFLKSRKELDYKRFSESAANQNNLFQLLTGMQEIKLNNCEKQKRWEWERIQAKLFGLGVKGLMLTQNQQVGSFFINQTKNIFISYLTAKAVVNGEMTLGMMVAVTYILGQLSGPINGLIGFIQSAQDASISLERLGEIHLKEDEDKTEDFKINELPENKDIRIENLTYHYEGPRSLKVLDNINLVIPQNKVTAIVGPSGSGKSTLIKLLLGYYAPTEGKISLGNFNLDQYNMEEWRSRVGTVMQEGMIFSDTIANNIAIGEDSPDKERLLYAANTSNIREYIENLPLRYNTKIGPEGSGISQGQKQRILIARAVYKNPDFLFLDEATNALDANNEKVIIGNLNTFCRGKTVVVVAHRLSTVKNAHQIIVLNKGVVTEVGVHEELSARKGEYYNLVKNQLELGN